MKKLFSPLALTVALLAGTSLTQASVVLNIGFAGRLQNQSGTTLTSGSLLQLVDLGADGIFNSIDVADASTGAGSVGQWTSGDDVLLHTALIGADFNFASAFDLAEAADPSTGVFGRSLEINATAGIKIGLRWFPSLVASTVQTNFGTFSLAGGTRYGQFTRNAGNPAATGGAVALYGGALWIVPGDGGNEAFDALATIDVAGGPGLDANSLGLAAFTVQGPEPTSGLLALIGAGVVGGVRRRRKA